MQHFGVVRIVDLDRDFDEALQLDLSVKSDAYLRKDLENAGVLEVQDGDDGAHRPSLVARASGQDDCEQSLVQEEKELFDVFLCELVGPLVVEFLQLLYLDGVPFFRLVVHSDSQLLERLVPTIFTL